MLCVFVIIICSESLPDRLKTLKVEVLEKHTGEIKVCCDSALHFNSLLLWITSFGVSTNNKPCPFPQPILHVQSTLS